MSDIDPILINQGAWAEWEEWRRVEKRKKITPRAKSMQWKMLAQYSLEDQRRIIEHSMMNDYQGLFPEKVASRRMDIRTNSTRHRTLSEDLNDRSWADG